jgi:nucleoside-diphosphate-sugar epimerase
MAVLITGGTGFVGINLVEQLLADGEHVHLFAVGGLPAMAKGCLADLPGRLTVIEGDVRDSAALAAALAGAGADRIIHAAAVTAGAERERDDFAAMVGVNVGGTLEVLEAARQTRVRRVLVLSSVAIYGAGAGAGPALDEDAPPNPGSLYAVTKYAAEQIALRYGAAFGLDVLVARVGAVFGRWEYPTGLRETMSVPYQLAARAVRGEEARLPAAAAKDWIYAPDLARALCGLLDCKAPQFRLYNAGSGELWRVEDCAAALQCSFPKFRWRIVQDLATANINYHGSLARAPMSIERLHAQTGFAPHFGVATAFADYAAWLEEFACLLDSAGTRSA